MCPQIVCLLRTTRLILATHARTHWPTIAWTERCSMGNETSFLFRGRGPRSFPVKIRLLPTFLPTDRRVGNYRPFVRIWVGQEAHGSEGTDVDFVLNVGKVKEESRKVVVGDYSSSVVPLPNRIRRAFYDGMTDRFLRFSLFESCRTQWNRGAWAASVPRGDLAGRGCASN